MPEAGWYPDPQGAVRWWDGERWTEHVQPSTLPLAPTGSAAAPGGGGRRTGLMVGGLLLTLLVVAGLVVAVVLLTRGGDDPVVADPTDDPTTSQPPSSEPTSDEPSEPEPTVSEPTIDPPAGPGPEVVAGQFMAAVVAVDCASAEALSTQEFLDTSGGCDAGDNDPDLFEGATYEIGEPVGDDERVTVDVDLTVIDETAGELPLSFTLTLVDTDLGWRVDDLSDPS